MRGLQVLACLAFFGTCAGKQLTIPSSRKQDAVDATAREVVAELTTRPVSQEQGHRHLKDASCEAYSVYGSKSQSEKHGTYVAKRKCDGKILYECVDCSSSDDQYLFYYTPHKDWKIGPDGCGDPTAGFQSKNDATFDDPASTQWMEWSNSDWVETPTISVSCVTTPATCESYSVSGSKHRSHYHGTYVAKGECEGSTAYECVDCSSPATLIYIARYGEWEIGPPQACRFRHTTRMRSSIASNDPSSGQWKELEYKGSKWVKTPTIKVKCEGEVHYLNLAAIVGEAVSEASTPSIAMMLIIGMLCGSVVAFLHFLRKQPRKNADETPLLDQGGEAL